MHGLTVGWLKMAIAGLADDLPVELEHYDGTGGVVKLRPMHIDLRGHRREAEAVVIVGH